MIDFHFIKIVTIVKMRVYLDFEQDESYTPTRMVFAAGQTGEHYGVHEFSEWKGETPRGWQDVSFMDNVGQERLGINGGGAVRCMFLQIRIMENHQNGKDTHVRGVQIFSKEETDFYALEKYGYPAGQWGKGDSDDEDDKKPGKGKGKAKDEVFYTPEGMTPPSWLVEPVIR